MCQYSADHGQATAWHRTHLGALSLSGAALLMIEATAVSPEGRITHGCLGLWDDATEAALARMLAAIRPHALTPIGIQIAHAGRKASSARPWEGGALPPLESGGWETIGPSALPQRPEEPPPRAMTEADLARARPSSPPRGAPSAWGWPRSNCTPHTAICCMHSCRPWLTSAPTPTAARARTACAIRWKCSRRCARRCRMTCRSACACRAPTGSRAAGRWRIPSPSRRRCARVAAIGWMRRQAVCRRCSRFRCPAGTRCRLPTPSVTRPAFPPSRSG
uniref:NADH:flavin oxidoreductase/NADH oxidase N-terminal domain-containing protein n=1 Tax=Ralstonia solanacearum TaxID=305 RepID=A0A0S4TWJ8_RALSL|nr:protein of unknown function [Ralstonia solanacearum]